MPIEGPWYITHTAVEQYLALLRRPVSDAERVRAEGELREQIAGAHFVKAGRVPRSEIWRGPAPLRLRFLVRMRARREGDAPQLVRVEGAHAQARPRATAPPTHTPHSPPCPICGWDYTNMPPNGARCVASPQLVCEGACLREYHRRKKAPPPENGKRG